MVREYFRWRLEEALEVLPTDSAMLAEVLNEMFALLVGEEEIKGWRAPALEDVHSRIGESLKGAPRMDKCRAVLTDTGRRAGKRAQRRCARIAEEPGLGVRFISDTEGIEGERGEFRSLATEAIEATIIAKSVR